MSPIFSSNVFEFTSGSAAQTARIGERLGELLVKGDVICLRGELGAGKTTMAQGVGAGWGAQDEVTSPTFTLIRPLTRACDAALLYHIDLYRVESEREARLLGLSDLLNGHAACMIEWPERAPTLLPASRLSIDLAVLDETRRRLTFRAQGERYLQLLEDVKRCAFGIHE
jgi:tRNA threonylcarbamoyladenosine biosynthesis protein TsaE